eukprot:CAMPEP_0196803472 /NCGR_PEP_ID=MMETSP1362-20130617/2893_1 /TAXON_ID=163516 /ORGANISM="Leptocylindrus danicus, Strain CCMP1856" /LENGTH=252 /DNA_ID=CAMNT_0042175099 /DNA_START=207 /DNA_END=965 /DNA_ORIENTATION=-
MNHALTTTATHYSTTLAHYSTLQTAFALTSRRPLQRTLTKFARRNNSSSCNKGNVPSNAKTSTSTSNNTRTFSSSSSSSSSSSTTTRTFSNNIHAVSARGQDAVKLLPSYLADARAAQPLYHPIDAPHGALQLGVAENYLMQEGLTSKLTQLQQSLKFDADHIYYQPTQGRIGTRRAMTRLFNRILSANYSFDEDCMIVGAGCNAVLENLAICLAEVGDAVIIPTPYYAAFEFDLVARAGLRIQPVTAQVLI